MLYQISDGTVSASGHVILSHINFEIGDREKIAVVGRNGAGKTTLLKLIGGLLELDRDDRRQGPGITSSRKITIGMLEQNAFAAKDRTVEEELLAACPFRDSFERERFVYEQEYDRLFTGFGFLKADKRKKLSEFSGGEQTKIALIRLLLLKPDLLLLDEPTNHLDIQTVEWLEDYMRSYEKAVVEVSHDRFFLDRTAQSVYELEAGRLTRYPGNYTRYREQKLKKIALQRKAYDRQQEELKRLEGLVERFKHKPKKASFARAKRSAADRMERIEKPVADDVSLFTGEINPLIHGSKWVFESEHLKIGYDRVLLELSLRVRRGQKIGILGDNGVGKSTFLKTVAGLIPKHSGKYSLGNNTVLGYFDQHSAEISSPKTVAEHFHDLFPSMTEKEVRSILGAYLFSGRQAQTRVDDLSGGEKARLVLAELLQSRPNLLLLDEPTNHMDIQAKETLESAFRAYTGTILFISHDRYFVRQVAESILIFEGQSAFYYPFGYEHYLEKQKKSTGEELSAQIQAEEQALIAGLRAVPKAEHHRLREIPVEEAYRDWRLRLKGEKLFAAQEQAGALILQLEEREEAWRYSRHVWLEEEAEPENGAQETEKQERELAALRLKTEEALRLWQQECLDWYEIWEE